MGGWPDQAMRWIFDLVDTGFGTARKISGQPSLLLDDLRVHPLYIGLRVFQASKDDRAV